MKPIIFGISGKKLTDQEAAFFTANPVLGFILFARNIESQEQVIALNKSLKALYPEREVPILVDQEGGRVARLKPPVFKELHPTAQHFADLYQTNPAEAKASLENNYYQLSHNLKDLSFDSPCSPVCDLKIPGASNVIGDRSFGQDVKQVTELCKSAINGIKKAKGIPIIKHIPGHGRALLDSHLDLPVVNTDIETLEKTDFAIFKSLSGDKDLWAMTAHIVYNALDDKLPATLSKKAIDYIRQEIGFKGTLLTDDMGMYALHGEIGKKHRDLKNAANPDQIKTEFIANLAKTSKMALDAGCDVILHCSGDIDEMNAIMEIL